MLVIRFLLLLVLFIFSAQTSFAKAPGASPSGSSGGELVDETGKSQNDDDRMLRGGWYLWDPYQYVESGEGFHRLTGLDVQLVRAIAKNIGYKIQLNPIGWKEHLDGLKNGARDIASGATKTKEREEFVYFSKPYRHEENSLYVRKGLAAEYKFQGVADLLNRVPKLRLRLGVVDGFIYADPRINEFIKDPQNKELIYKFSNDFSSLNALIENKVDAFLADRIVASTAIWRTGNADSVEEVYLNIKTPIHLIFSKKTVEPGTVELFNQSIDKTRESGQYSKIVSSYLYAVLLLQTISKPWFFAIDILGTVAFALSGLFLAYRERATLLGALIFALLPSVGGGIMRDVIVMRAPIGVLVSPTYLMTIVSIVVAGYFFIRLLHFFGFRKFDGDNESTTEQKSSVDAFIRIFDTLGLAAYTITGVVVSVVSKSDPLWLWGPLLSVLTGAGGGVLRDLLRTDFSTSDQLLKDQFYAEVAFIWGFALSFFITLQKEIIDPEMIFFGVVGSMIGVVVTRYFAIKYGWKSLSFTIRAHHNGNSQKS